MERKSFPHDPSDPQSSHSPDSDSFFRKMKKAHLPGVFTHPQDLLPTQQEEANTASRSQELSQYQYRLRQQMSTEQNFPYSEEDLNSEEFFQAAMSRGFWCDPEDPEYGGEKVEDGNIESIRYAPREGQGHRHAQYTQVFENEEHQFRGEILYDEIVNVLVKETAWNYKAVRHTFFPHGRFLADKITFFFRSLQLFRSEVGNPKARVSPNHVDKQSGGIFRGKEKEVMYVDHGNPLEERLEECVEMIHTYQRMFQT